MITCKRIVILLIAVMALSSCAAPGTAVNPRTMTFPPLKFAIPESARAVLPNGMVVYMLEDHELPLVNMTAYIHVGSIYDPADKTGLAGLTGAVLRSGGTTETPPDKLDAELEFMASSIESGIGADAGNVSMATLVKNFDRTAELFAQVLMSPAFREDRFKVAVNKGIEAIRRQNDDPKGVANRELTKALYAGHPLGRFPTIGTMKSITRDDLAEFHRRYYHPNNIILAVSGDFKKDELLARLTRLFGGWKKETVALPNVGNPATEVRPEILFVRKEVSQSVIRMGEMGIDKNNPDLYPLRVMDYILGGGFTSRLTQEVRSNQGLAYNVESSVDAGRTFIGTITAETETKSESTVKAITLIREIITGMTAAPVTDQELSLAKEFMINSFIFGFTKPDAVVNQQARLEFFGYPKGYLEQYRDNIARVTREDVLRVARKYLHPDRMVLMVVGNDRKFDKPLATFGAVREIKLENGK
ncbi:MAG TPA: pitrilysin family protein [Geobacteraceae bacterium]|nr:pitrilysin family protein [Geobacteraceae bacterium]